MKLRLGDTWPILKSGRYCVSLCALALMVAIALAGDPARAQGEKFPAPDDRSVEWELAFGGKLYDNWFAATFQSPPVARHPLMPEAADAASAMSWRCATCHGFDYSGGTLSRGASRAPLSVPGLAAMRGAEVSTITAYLRRPPHGYGPEQMSESAMTLLARFVADGQHDPAQYLENGGSEAKGRPIFQGVCISCHEADGRAYIEGEPGDLPALGWLARNRPAQVLHKIRNGFPGADMVALRFMDAGDIADLFAYMRTLPDPE